jgi:outer membrane biosynthesis protein TonB
MTPSSQPPEDTSSSKVNLLISFIFHAVLVLVLFYFAARQGFLGNQIQKITIQLIKEKPPQPPKPPPKPPVEIPKPEPPKVAAVPKTVEAPRAAVAPTVAPPTVAPPPTELPTFDFDGGRTVISSSDPIELYRSAIEMAFRSKWNRPENMDDDNYAVEIQVSVQPDGQIGNIQWQKGSGNSIWDESVRQAIASVKSMDTSPPTNFPPYINIRFDVQEETEPISQ